MADSQAESALVAWGVGPWSRGEFAVLRTILGTLGEWPQLPALADAIESLDGSAVVPEVLLLAQPYPGFYSAVELAAIGRLAPLTRVVVVAGTWTEGEPRTGQPLPGATRMYWYHFADWWRRALAVREAGGCPPWADPLTDPRQPRRAPKRTMLGVNGSSPDSATPAPGSHSEPDDACVAVDTGDFDSFESLQLALRPFGWRCVWQPRHRPEVWNSVRATGGIARPAPIAGIWDGGQFDAPELQQLAAFSERLAERRAPVIALLDFPRAEHVEAAAAAGAVAVVGKPYLVEGVAGELTAAVTSRQPALNGQGATATRPVPGE